MKKVACIAPLGLVLLAGCAEKQTHFGVTLATQTWINLFITAVVVGALVAIGGLVALVRWLVLTRR